MMEHQLNDEVSQHFRSADELGPYRSVSSLAVAALLLSLCSLVAFISPLLVVVPLAAIGTALLALARIGSHRDSLIGSGLARVALALAIALTVAPSVRDIVRSELTFRQADVAARQWLANVSSNRFAEALEGITGTAYMRIQQTAGSNTPPVDQGREFAAKLFSEDPLVYAARCGKANSQAVFLSAEKQVFLTTRPPQVVANYQAACADGQSAQISLVLKRALTRDGTVFWLVDSWGLGFPTE